MRIRAGFGTGLVSCPGRSTGKEVESTDLEVVERGEIVFHAGVEEEPLAESKNHAREHARITGDDRTVGLPIADRGFIVGEEFREDLLEPVT